MVATKFQSFTAFNTPEFTFKSMADRNNVGIYNTQLARKRGDAEKRVFIENFKRCIQKPCCSSTLMEKVNETSLHMASWRVGFPLRAEAAAGKLSTPGYVAARPGCQTVPRTNLRSPCSKPAYGKWYNE